jgi:hypothetical protein
MPKTSKPEPVDVVDDDEPPAVALLEINFNGDTFTVPKSRDEWSVESELAMFEARATNLSYWWTKWTELALGPVQWQKLLDQTLKNRGDLIAFVQHFVKTVTKECGE